MSDPAARESRPLPTVGAVVLTMGRRPVELERALESLLGQEDVTLDVVVVGNGWEPTGLPSGVRGLYLETNVGIPAGRNAGVPHVDGEFLLFLDDDAWFIDPGFLAEAVRRLQQDPDLGMMQPRIVDPERRGQEPDRWIPRLRKGNPASSSSVFSVIELVVVMPRVVFDSTTGWPDPFFYAHEGIELAWRVWDLGYRVEYHGDLEVGHPVVDPARHKEYFRLNARNRVWLARRCLPWPLSWLYVANWTGVQIVRSVRNPQSLPQWLAGWIDGWRENPWAGQRRPAKLAWRTVTRMTRHGRAPII